MITIQNDFFSLQDICNSGQCFRMKALPFCEEEKGFKGYRVVAFEKILDVYQNGNKIYFDCTQGDFDSTWAHYFDVKRDYEKILSLVDSEDTLLTQASDFGKGIRILQQDLWETLVSFIISQQSNIPRIRKSIEMLCDRYGELVDDTVWGFPTPEALACQPEEAFKECGLGYRAKYVLRAAQEVVSGKINISEIENASYEKAKELLLKIYGVGDKVADCVCLFSLHHLQAFPKDVHINRILENHYLNRFPFDKYYNYAGVLQQYLFYYDLKKGVAS